MKRSVPYLLPLLLLLSCGDNSTDPEGEDGKIMPLAVGNRWIGRVTEGIRLVLGVQVESVDTTVSVEAGEFRALVYREFIVSPENLRYPTTNRSFYSPGVGIVLYEQKHESGDIDFRWELAAYRMGEK